MVYGTHRVLPEQHSIMKKTMYKLLFTAFVALITSGMYGQAPPKQHILIAGRVKDVTSGEPLPNVTVRIKGATGATTTNVDGYFTLHNVPSDTAVIIFTMIGYEPLHYHLSSAQSLKNIAVNLVNTSKSLEEIIITGQKQEAFKLNQKVGMIKLTPAAIATLPNMGQKDIFRSFQLMPGVSAGNEQTAGLYVRGGTPDQNLVLFDGFTVYNVDHLFGFFSAFNANAVKDVQLFKGTFEAKYGGRLSSVVDITGKEGNKKTFNGGIDLGFLGVNAFVESPLGKQVSGLITYRRSFKTGLYEKIADNVTGKENNEQGPVGNVPGGGPGGRGPGGNSEIKSFFDDLNAKFTFTPSQKDVISWSFYTGKDFLDNSRSSQGGRSMQGGTFNANTKDETQWGNTGTSLKWSRKWSPRFFINTLISYSNYFSNRTNTRQVNRDTTTTTTTGILEDNDLKDLTLKSDIEWTPNKFHSFGAGYQLTNNEIKYRYARSDTANIIDRHTSGNTYAFYLQDKLSLLEDKLVMTPGIRASWFEPTGKLYYEPRFNISYSITENIKLKGAAGQYYQFAKRVVREDILQGSRDFWVLADDNKLPVSSSTQYIAGASWENNEYLIDVEAYYKQMKGLSEYTLRFEPRPGQNNASYEEYFYEGTGFAKGVDMLLQKKFGRYNGWIGYTIGEVVSNFPVYGTANYYANNDVRHEFKMVHMYKIKNIDFSLTWMYLTGKPYTAPTGGYYVTLLDGTTQEYLVVTEKNALRLPAYHRLDFAVTINYGKPGKTNGAIGLSLFNCYNRKNVWYKSYDIEEGEIIQTDVNYLGFTPNISFSIKLK
jgi:ferric enterobactin receptor